MSRACDSAEVDGNGGTLLATDLYDEAIYAPLYLFGFNHDGSRVLYVRGAGYTEGKLVAVDVRGGAVVLFPEGRWPVYARAFVASPFGDDIAGVSCPVIVETPYTTIVVADLDTGTGQLMAPGQERAVSDVAFTPDGRGLVFTHSPSPPRKQLWYAPRTGSAGTTLGEWTTTYLPLQSNVDLQVDPRAPYPVDPTGCFVIVDTELAPGPGTILTLLPQ